jgi:hypothetical protein
MQKITIDKKELYNLIKEAVREVFQEETFRLWMESLPEISEEEMEDIERRYGKPSSIRDIAYSETLDV